MLRWRNGNSSSTATKVLMMWSLKISGKAPKMRSWQNSKKEISSRGSSTGSSRQASSFRNTSPGVKVTSTNFQIKSQDKPYYMKFSPRHLILIIAVLLSALNSNAQRDIPPRPSLQTSVYDEADVLSQAEEQNLERKLINYADTTSTQIVVVTINSLEGEYIGTYAAEWAHEWGIGTAEEDNGILVLLSEEDRTIWITTGYGIEGYLTDAHSKEIIDQIILPAFRGGSYYQGLDAGTTAIIQVLNGVYEGAPQRGNNPQGSSPRFIVLAIIFIIMMVIFS